MSGVYRCTCGWESSVLKLPQTPASIPCGRCGGVAVYSRGPRTVALDELERRGVEALARLIGIGKCDSGQCRHVRAFLIGLYNGPVFPFDLTNMRAVDTTIANDMLMVLAMDAHTPSVEVHQRIPGVSDVIARWAADAWPRDHDAAIDGEAATS